WPPLARLPAPVPAALGRRPLQAPAPVPALDGPARAARLRPVDLDLPGAVADADRHPRREHEPGDRSHAPALPDLEDGRGDHRATGTRRSRRPGEVRLRALPQANVGRLPRPPRRDRVRAVRPAGGLPTLARPASHAWLTSSWPPPGSLSAARSAGRARRRGSEPPAGASEKTCRAVWSPWRRAPTC